MMMLTATQAADALGLMVGRVGLEPTTKGL